MFFQEFDGFGSGLVVRLIGTVSFIANGDEHAMGHAGGLPVFKFRREDVLVETGVVAGSMGLFSRGIKTLGP